MLLCIVPALRLSAGPVEAARGVVERRVPALADKVHFELIQAPRECYETEASSGRLTVRGTTAVAMCRGFYDYLKDRCGCLITWEGSQLRLPRRLPDQAPHRVEAAVPLRQHFNVVTFGYTTAFWNWERWAFEIDWMALHGINMPLAMTGQEKVWQRLWKEHYALTDDELDHFFTGPAFLPWQRMGNFYGHDDEVLAMVGRDRQGHTLPQSFIERDAAMQQRILQRELELGMKPVIPGFSGFIPRALQTHRPDLRTWQPTPWNSACRSTLALHPLDPLFQQITDAYVDTYRQVYGDVSHYYLIDLFNEIDPPAGTTTTDLARIGRSVSEVLTRKDPQAVWVTQGWCFFYQNYWRDTTHTAAYLSEIPDSRLLIIDLNADTEEAFRLHPHSVARKQVIWSLLNDNWGQHTALHGDLRKIATRPQQARADLGSRLVGLGNSAEGIEHNAVCFELLYDNAWRTTPVDLDAWLATYAAQRYGTRSPLAATIWRKMLSLYYSNNTSDPPLPYQELPSRRVARPDSLPRAEHRLIDLMLSAPRSVRRSPLFQRDLVDVVKSYAGHAIRLSITQTIRAIDSHSPQVEACRARFDELMLGLDALLHTQPQHRLSRWTAAARSYAAPADADYMERNARLQLTTWVAPHWQGYARKEWSGLVGDFYRRRWQLFFDRLSVPVFSEQAFAAEVFNWSNAWCGLTSLPEPAPCTPEDQTRSLLRLIDQLPPDSAPQP